MYTYGKQLEQDSPRFPRASDFFVYIVFVQTFILVRRGLISAFISANPPISARLASSSSERFLVWRKTTLAPRAGPSFAINPRVCVRCEHGGNSELEGSTVDLVL